MELFTAGLGGCVGEELYTRGDLVCRERVAIIIMVREGVLWLRVLEGIMKISLT